MKKPFLLVDFDNTVMATEGLVLPSLVERFNILYGHLVPAPLTVEAFLEHFHGKARQSLCEALSKHFAIHVDCERLYEDREIYALNELKKTGVEMAHDVVEVLRELQQKYSLALVTNSPLHRVLSAMRYATNGRGAELAACFGVNFFEAFALPKPDPWVYLNALQLLDAPVQSSFAIEDSSTGVRSSTGAGLRTIGFVGFSQHPDQLALTLRNEGAVACFRSWREILAFIRTV
jgi:HAD superfamily hydrolase (TIGR01509 family)